MRLYIPAAIVSIIVFLGHLLGTLYDWYISFQFYDVLMHLAGGLAIGLLASAVSCSHGVTGRKAKWSVMAAVIIFGILWEVFEIKYDVTSFPVGTHDYYFDTAKDMVNDIIGGIVSLFIVGKSSLWQKKTQN